jgi:hypothetical protein
VPRQGIVYLRAEVDIGERPKIAEDLNLLAIENGCPRNVE